MSITFSKGKRGKKSPFKFNYCSVSRPCQGPPIVKFNRSNHYYCYFVMRGPPDGLVYRNTE
jgi:hypothetical protein